ncbi:MAG: hypothetical protein U1E34_02905 [Amaricoccus sp.]
MDRWMMMVAAAGAAMLASGPARAQIVQTTACAQYELMGSDDQRAAVQAALKAEGEDNSVLDVTPGQLAMALSNGCPTEPDKRLVDFIRELARQQ